MQQSMGSQRVTQRLNSNKYLNLTMLIMWQKFVARKLPTSLPQTIHVNLLISHDDFKRDNDISKHKNGSFQLKLNQWLLILCPPHSIIMFSTVEFPFGLFPLLQTDLQLKSHVSGLVFKVLYNLVSRILPETPTMSCHSNSSSTKQSSLPCPQIPLIPPFHTFTHVLSSFSVNMLPTLQVPAPVNSLLKYPLLMPEEWSSLINSCLNFFLSHSFQFFSWNHC